MNWVKNSDYYRKAMTKSEKYFKKFSLIYDYCDAKITISKQEFKMQSETSYWNRYYVLTKK